MPTSRCAGETVAVRPGEPSVVALDGQGPRLTGVPSTSDLRGIAPRGRHAALRLDPDPCAGAPRGERGGGTARPRLMARPAVAVFETESPSALTFLQSLGSRGVPIHVYGPGRFPPGRLSPHCVRAQRCPDPVRFDDFQAWLRERLRRGEIARVAPTSDLMAYHCAALRDEFPPEVRDTVPGLAEIEDILIKSRFNARCESLGIPVPRTWYPESPAEAAALAPELPYPVMIKPRSHLGVGMDYRGEVVHDAAAFLAAFGPRPATPGQEPLLRRYPGLRWPMVQEFPPGAPEVHSLCGMRDHRAGIVAEAAVCKTDLWPPEVGIGTRFVTTDDPRHHRGRQAGHRRVPRPRPLPDRAARQRRPAARDRPQPARLPAR